MPTGRSGDATPFYEIVERTPVGPIEGAFLNVLESEMPECNRGEGDRMVRLDDGGGREEVCNVYCAQRSCGAAREYLSAHEGALRDRCGSVRYLHGGALEMDASDLADGRACHAKVVGFNLQNQGGELAGACLTCGDDATPVPAAVRPRGETCGREVEATLVRTEGVVPEWYHRTGVLGSLPNHFSCDPRYKGPSPTPHAPEDGDSVVEVDVRGTDIAPDATIGYWASRPTEGVSTAPRAYGDFSNRGIARCKQGICSLPLTLPTPYTEKGKVWKPHVHFSEWKGGRWDLTARTLNLSES
jgi:hypothetical protein